MRRSVLLFIVGVVLPMVSSFITYTLVTLEANAMPLDETGGLIILLAFLKLLLISTTGVFPIDMNSFFSDLMERQRKKRDVIMDGSTSSNRNATLYQVPDVDLMPCTRRFLCELETVAKTSDKYLPKRANAIDDGEDNWNPEEDVAPEQVDPLSELQIEAARALFRDEDPTGELSERSKKGLAVIEGLTGSVCEEAYRLCPGRFTAPTLYRTFFDEINLEISANI
ncbi:uncharacterized protein LOC135216450 [Macrobrachium nipponense]|uniref:uncharacterized protein LOC135216450 n=1 Tax=Macrobrachium nipponense TaxID=159736 RepID=UPI0030C7D1ED